MTIVLDGSNGITAPGGTAAAPSITTTGDVNTGIFFPAADTIAFSEGGVEAMRIDSSGNVGIGTASPISAIGASVTAAGVFAASGYLGTHQTSKAVIEWNANVSRIRSYGATASTGVIAFSVGGGGGFTDSEAMRIDAAGNVGIGTSSPGALLHTYTATQESVRFARNSTASSAYVTFYANNSSSAQVQYAGILGDVASSTAGSHSGNLLFYTTGSGTSAERVRIDSSGNLGIGTTSPSAYGAIVVVRSQNSDARMWVRNDDVGSSSRASYVVNASGNSWSMGMGSTANNSNSLTWVTDVGGGNNEKMRIDTSGNLLVGTTTITSTGQSNSISTATCLAVGGPLTAHTSSKGIFEFNSNAVSIRAYGSTAGSGLIVFSTGGGGNSADAERARIDSSGNLLVGTTSGTEHRLYKSSSTYSTRIENTSTTAGSVLLVQSGRAAGTGFTLFEGYANGSLVVQIFGNGNLQNTNNSYGAISDIKLKQDIVDAASQWEDIKNLRVRKYRFKRSPDAPLQIGLVAQELEKVSPGLVKETADYDAEGNDLGTTTKSVKYSVLYMKAIKALQEAMARIETLEAKVAALEGNN